MHFYKKTIYLLTVALLLGCETGRIAIQNSSGPTAPLPSRAKLTVLNTNLGPGPIRSIAFGEDGNIYGTLGSRGSTFWGAVFRCSAAGACSIVHQFSGPDGTDPVGKLTKGKDGTIYGVTFGGGPGTRGPSAGSIYKISPKGEFSIISRLDNQKLIHNPEIGVTEGVDGNLYGIASGYGMLNDAHTIVYRASRSGKISDVFGFQLNDGLLTGLGSPKALLLGRDGYFYGSLQKGGPGERGSSGFIFKIDTSGRAIRLFQLDMEAGRGVDRLIESSDGNIYGTTLTDGDTNPGNGFGGIFKLKADSPRTQFTNIIAIKQTNRISNARGLVEVGGKRIYGILSGGYLPQSTDTIFKIKLNDTVAALEPVYTFTLDPSLGINSSAQIRNVSDIVEGPNGEIYGVTSFGGNQSSGVLFKLSDLGN